MARPPRPATEIARVREEIVVAAERVLARRGLNDTSVDEIAREVGLSPGTLYGYFSSRNAILAEVVEHAILRVVACIQAPRPRSLDVRSRLECVAIDMLGLATEHRAVLELMLSRRLTAEDDALRDRLQKVHAQVRLSLRDLLAPAVDPATGQDPERLAWGFLGLVRVEWIHLISEPEAVDLPDRAESLVHLFLYGALAPRPSREAHDVVR